MRRQSAAGFALLLLVLGGSCLAAEGERTVVIYAGQVFDGKSDALSSNQVIVIQGPFHERGEPKKKRSGFADAADEADWHKKLKVHVFSPGKAAGDRGSIEAIPLR
jgi:hypothetical protein